MNYVITPRQLSSLIDTIVNLGYILAGMGLMIVILVIGFIYLYNEYEQHKKR